MLATSLGNLPAGPHGSTARRQIVSFLSSLCLFLSLSLPTQAAQCRDRRQSLCCYVYANNGGKVKTRVHEGNITTMLFPTLPESVPCHSKQPCEHGTYEPRTIDHHPPIPPYPCALLCLLNSVWKVVVGGGGVLFHNITQVLPWQAGWKGGYLTPKAALIRGVHTAESVSSKPESTGLNHSLAPVQVYSWTDVVLFYVTKYLFWLHLWPTTSLWYAQSFILCRHFCLKSMSLDVFLGLGFSWCLGGVCGREAEVKRTSSLVFLFLWIWRVEHPHVPNTWVSMDNRCVMPRNWLEICFFPCQVGQSVTEITCRVCWKYEKH